MNVNRIRTWLCTLTMVCSIHLMHGQYCYWQQEADYTMSIDLDVKTNRFTGSQTITYTNNSPDTLHQVFYHLYFNAFQPGSMMDVRNLSLPDPDARVADRISRLTPEEEGQIHIKEMYQNRNKLNFIEEGTILEVELTEPILPNSTVELSLTFYGQVPLQIRRSGRDNAEGVRYSMSQWYPKLCMYDYRGWHANPYIGREFYGNWGDFDVLIQIDEDYVVAGSGILTNADEIGFGYSDKRAKPKAKKGKVKWQFKAENVHDFVWAADPDYTVVTHQEEGTPLMYFVYQRGEETSAWERLPQIMAEAFRYINKRYGSYPFPVYAFIQGGDGGMEYPMATLITGHRNLNSLVGVSVHELLHSWYQMMLATDEARFAWMDEGFTSYASDETMQHLKEKFAFGVLIESDELHQGLVESYARFTQSGYEEPLSIHSDHFNTNTAYGVGAYTKGAVYLVQIRYIIGEELFDRLMLQYFHQWAFKHPEPNDFLRIAEKLSGLELDWFNQYFINTTEFVDYGLDLEYSGTGSLDLYRKGRFPMPIDLAVTYDDQHVEYFTIPLRMMRGYKSSEKGIVYQVLEDWPWTHPNYVLNLPNPERIIKIEIDPSRRLMDVERSNNVWVKQ